jgi:hypothetical protein
MDPQVAKEGHFGQVVEAAYASSSWVSASSAVRAHGQLSWSAGGPPKWPATRMARTPTMTCPNRHAIVVTGSQSYSSSVSPLSRGRAGFVQDQSSCPMSSPVPSMSWLVAPVWGSRRTHGSRA